ncbi:hypothetical protein LCGC14_2149480, partial [marine sediment metagenome]
QVYAHENVPETDVNVGFLAAKIQGGTVDLGATISATTRSG